MAVELAKKALGKAYRKGISLVKLMRMFPNDAAAETWFIEQRWPDGVSCPHCGSVNVKVGCAHKTMPFRCREKECGKRFSTKTRTVMEASNLGYQTWAIAIYLSMTNYKSVSSMKLHRDLEITQKSAWHLLHRLCKSYGGKNPLFSGPAEADETYVGGSRRNLSNKRRKELADTGRGAVGKAVVAGLKDRDGGKVAAQVVTGTDAQTLQGFVRDNAESGAMVYTEEAGAYAGLSRDCGHEAVKHGVAEYVRGQARINRIASFWSMLKRAHKGTFYKFSPKHLDRYVTEFAGRHNLREHDTADMMGAIVSGLEGRHLRYQDLIADNGLNSGARS